MKSPFDKSTESTRRFDNLNISIQYSFMKCARKVDIRKQMMFLLQTFTLTSDYVCDKVQYISPMTQITFRALLVLIITTVFYQF